MKTLLHSAEILLRALVGALFVYAGSTKIADPRAFADAIHAFHVLQVALIDPLAVSLPIFEVLVGLSIVLGWRLRENALSAALMTAVFLAVLIQANLRGLDTDCGCFGPGEWTALRSVPPIVRDLALLAGTLFLRLCRPAPG